MPLPTWHIADELRRAAGFRQMMASAPDATEASAASDSKDADLMARAAERLEKLDAAVTHALPLVKSYAHTQGDNADFHASLIAPLLAALGKRPKQDSGVK